MNNFVSIPKKKKTDGMFFISLYEKENSLNNFMEINGLYIYFSDKTNVISVVNQDDETIGVMIGVVIDYKNKKVIKEKFKVDDNVENYVESVESQIYQMCGTWIFVLCNNNYKRLYLDPCGSYSTVYDAKNKSVSSITGQLLSDKEFIDSFDGALYSELNVNNMGWFPAGLTAHKNISRLLCNHYLDLDTFVNIRHWPKEKFIQNNDVDKTSQRIATIIQSTIKALVEDDKTCLTLTGGKDSRLILSTVASFKNEVDFATINLSGSELDVFLANEIASFGSLQNHSVYPPVRATTERTIEWLYNASYTVGGVNQYFSPSIAPLSKYKYLIGGAAGEIGRAFLWSESDTAETTITASELLSRLGLKYNKKVEKEIDNWLSELSDFDTFSVLDLAYAELRVSPWAFAQSYSYEGRASLVQISPFVNREIISLLFSLPASARKKESYVYKGIKYFWPELLKIQFNKFNDYRDVIELFKKIFIPGMLKSKLRKMFLH